ncbi:MAG: hypothetical protein IPM24_00520 [Bryobacterales bacterium]|nr:hypothetical protein [Bryobacterales bacterium]
MNAGEMNGGEMKYAGAMKYAVWLLAAAAWAQAPPTSYRVENVPMPRGIAPESSAVTFTPDGSLAATFRRGGLYIYDQATAQWNRFASGFQTPLGVLAGKPGEFFVVHLPELTRVVDTNADGKADLYETLSDAWGMSGNYHEFISGPARDAAGNFYVSMGSSSGAADPRLPVRGALTDRGRASREPKPGLVNRVGHYAPTLYRGCIVQVTPQRETKLFACGFRQPNGLVVTPEGDLFAVDNQGDWIGTSPLHHVTEGAFHGHPSSLNWHPDFAGRDPVDIPVEELDRKRKRPAIEFPQFDMAGSVAGPAVDTSGGAFGPYSGQMLVADWTYPRVLRADLEKVGGVWQGAAFILFEANGLRTGSNRLALAPDGKSLYIAQTSRIWGATEGIQRLVYTGRVPMDIQHMRLTKTGFELTFTRPVDRATAGNPANYAMSHYYYRYHGQYGSPKTDVTPVKVTGASVSWDKRRVTLRVDNLVADRVFELRPSGIRSAEGEPLSTRIAAYTVRRLRE